MGILNKPNINLVQQCMLTSVIVRKQEQEIELEQLHFEQNMVINNPEMYKKYIETKEENSENEGIVWSTPQSIEEIYAIDQIVSDINDQLVNEVTEEEKKANEEFVKKFASMDLFENIDIDQIGDDE
jgi:hypothetical protein